MAMTVTVLMPIRNYDPDYLRDAVDSVLRQTSPDWRLLGIVDGIERGGLDAVLAARLHDPRIGLILNEGRKLAGALNTGMRHARSDFVAILLGDDMWEPVAVEVLLRNIHAHPGVDFFHSARRVVKEDGEPISDVLPSRPGVTLHDFGPDSPVSHLLCWRREKALSFGGMDESLNSVGPDDYDFPWSMAEHGAVFAHIPECLYVYRDHRSYPRLTTHVPRSVHIREIRRIQRKHGMGRLATERFIFAARRGYLRQCLYRSRADRWLKERLRIGRASAPRESYW
jgi:glycosyltransferase involved in cell wall biosynthesis